MPTNIFKIINDNIITLSGNMDERLNELNRKIDALYTVFYQSSNEDTLEMPKTDGVAPTQV